MKKRHTIQTDITIYFAHQTQGRAAALPVLQLAIQHNRMPTLMGKYKAPHYDAKGEANKFFVEAGVPSTLLLIWLFGENMIYFGQGPKRGQAGKLALTLPMADKKLPGIAAEDIGKCAHRNAGVTIRKRKSGKV